MFRKSRLIVFSEDMATGKLLLFLLMAFGIATFSFSAGVVHGAVGHTTKAAEHLVRNDCRPSPPEEKSELCAQWVSADATAEAARWAFWQMVFSALGVAGLVITLAFNYAAWKQARESEDDAREALKIAQRTAEAGESNADMARQMATEASRANTLVRETMELQLRPHIYVVDIRASIDLRSRQTQDDSLFAEAIIMLRNFGQTPAQSVTLRARLFLGGYWSDNFEQQLDGAAEVPLGAIPPNVDMPQSPYTVIFPRSDEFHIDSAMESLFLEGQLAYRDGFGNQYFTNFRQACTGRDDFSRLKFRPCPHWNEAT